MEQIGAPPTLKLGERGIVSPCHLEMKIYSKVKMVGIDLFLQQNWGSIFDMSKREVYVPLVKELYDCTTITSQGIIKTRMNNEIISLDVREIAATLGVNLSDGEEYSKDWDLDFDDADCTWRDQKKPIVTEANNLLEELKFAKGVVGKFILPREGSRNHVNYHARYALYKILKGVKVNLAHLIWDYLISFIAKPNSNLPFGSLITVLIEKKKIVNLFLDENNRLKGGMILSTPIKVSDAQRMGLKIDDSEILEEFETKKKKKRLRLKEKKKKWSLKLLFGFSVCSQETPPIYGEIRVEEEEWSRGFLSKKSYTFLDRLTTSIDQSDFGYVTYKWSRGSFSKKSYTLFARKDIPPPSPKDYSNWQLHVHQGYTRYAPYRYFRVPWAL